MFLEFLWICVWFYDDFDQCELLWFLPVKHDLQILQVNRLSVLKVKSSVQSIRLKKFNDVYHFPL